MFKSNYNNTDTILVASGDQALVATGALTDPANNALNIASGQLGAISSRFGQTRGYNDFLQAGDTVATARYIKLVQGTPNSANTRAASRANIGHKTVVESVELDGNAITTITAALASDGARDSYLLGSTTALNAFAATDGFEHKLHITWNGQRQDQLFSASGMLKVTPTTDPIDYTALGYTAAQSQQDVISRLIYRISLQSEAYTQLGLTNRAQGNRKYVAFAISQAAGAGTALGAIAAGTAFDVLTKNGITHNFYPDADFVNTVTQLIANNTEGITAASTIEVVDMDSTPAGGDYEFMWIVSLDHEVAAVHDESRNRKIFLNVGQETGNEYLKNEQVSFADEGKGLGWQVGHMWDRWYKLWNQDVPWEFDNAHSNITLPNYVDQSLNYTVYIIANTPTATITETTTAIPQPKRVIILVPNTAGATDATTLGDLNAVLGPWLASANISQAEGTGAAPNYFV